MAAYHPGGGFRGNEGDVLKFVEKNVLGTLQLIEAARRANVGRFVFISTCAVHEKIFDDRPLDETHPTWAASHYGASRLTGTPVVNSLARASGWCSAANDRAHHTTSISLAINRTSSRSLTASWASCL
ncbi:MAG: NAD-dependent epimerase/dehydratase family protein [Thermoguttaceae bacterium]